MEWTQLSTSCNLSWVHLIWIWFDYKKWSDMNSWSDIKHKTSTWHGPIWVHGAIRVEYMSCKWSYFSWVHCMIWSSVRRLIIVSPNEKYLIIESCSHISQSLAEDLRGQQNHDIKLQHQIFGLNNQEEHIPANLVIMLHLSCSTTAGQTSQTILKNPSCFN